MSHIGTRATHEFKKLFDDFCKKEKRSKTEVITTALLKEITGINPSLDEEWRPLAAKLFALPISKVRYAVTLPTVHEALLFMSDKSEKMSVDRIPDDSNYVFQFTINEEIFLVSVSNLLSKYDALREIFKKLDKEILGGLEEWESQM